MKIDEFLDYYQDLSASILSLESIYESKRRSNMRQPLGDMDMYRLSFFADDEGVMRIYKRKREMFDRLTLRIKRAIMQISDEKIVNYLMMRYLMGMKNIEICEKTAYCERQIYRLSKKAKAELAKYLSTSKRTAMRLTNKVYRKSIKNKMIA